MSALTDALSTAINTLFVSGAVIPASSLRAFQLEMVGAIAMLEARARGNTIHYTPGVPADALGIEGDLGVNQTTGDFYQYTGGTFVFLFNGLGKTGSFVAVPANAYGTHPAFLTQLAWDVWLTQNLGSAPIAPPAPTVPGVAVLSAPTAGVGQMAVSWAAPTNTGGAPITSYTVKYRPVGAATYSVFGTTASLAATVTGLTAGTAYQLVLLATNSVGTGAASDPVTGTPTGASTGTPAPSSIFLRVIGDSITFGMTTVPYSSTNPINGYGNQLVRRLNNSSYIATVTGWPGQDARWYITNHAADDVTAIKAAVVAGQLPICVIDFGANSIAKLGATQTIADLQELHTMFRNAGAKTIAVPLMNRTDGYATGPATTNFNADRLTVNNALASATWCNAYAADLAANATLYSQTAVANLQYFTDQVHPTEFGAQLMSIAVATAVASVSGLPYTTPTSTNTILQQSTPAGSQAVVFAGLVGASATGNILTKTATTAAWDAGARGTLAIGSVGGTGEQGRIFYLLNRNAGGVAGGGSRSFTDATNASIDTAFFGYPGGQGATHRSTSLSAQGGPAITGQFVPVELVFYPDRTEILFNNQPYITDATAPVFPIVPDFSLYDAGAQAVNVAIRGGNLVAYSPAATGPVSRTVQWGSLLNSTFAGGVLTKVSGSGAGWGDGGAEDPITIAQPAAGATTIVAFPAVKPDRGAVVVGLSPTSNNGQFTSINYGLYYYPNGYEAFAAGSPQGSASTGASGLASMGNLQFEVTNSSILLRNTTSNTLVWTFDVSAGITWPLKLVAALYNTSPASIIENATVTA